MKDTSSLELVVPNGGRPKGLVRYSPRAGRKIVAARIMDVLERMRASDALPIGPRAVGYRLKELYPGEYTKDDFPMINEIITRLTQASLVPWEWVSDGAAVTYEADGWASPASFLQGVPDTYNRDRRERQPLVVEIFTEARETLPLIRRVASERGVTPYSGSGSNGPSLALKVAARALTRAVDYEQSTLILGICDFDLSGLRNVLRPHLEHVGAFLYGTSDNEDVLSYHGLQASEIDAKVSFRHLALTPELAHGIVTDREDRERIVTYIASGVDVWTRDLSFLEGIQKVETEALDPVELRRVVVEAIEDAIDAKALEDVVAEEETEREDIRSRLNKITDATDRGAA
ncbi:MAG TPA: hypothetical protein VNJ54_11325 [Plantibacter sp.]|uniref:hypothetical protein n=1 Tax=Plantibacter sp. TaxID=1871045 RepID=UPI002CBF5941|nr:hypothetical protein [Plantibacter sp.]